MWLGQIWGGTGGSTAVEELNLKKKVGYFESGTKMHIFGWLQKVPYIWKESHKSTISQWKEKKSPQDALITKVS